MKERKHESYILNIEKKFTNNDQDSILEYGATINSIIKRSSEISVTILEYIKDNDIKFILPSMIISKVNYINACVISQSQQEKDKVIEHLNTLEKINICIQNVDWDDKNIDRFDKIVRSIIYTMN